MNSSGSILIVDDEPGNRLALRHSLIAMGYHVSEASSAERAIYLARERRFDTVLLDVNMPGGGIETCRAIRRECPRLGILMLTVLEDVTYRVEALEAGADDYITKPFVIGEVAARIRAIRRGRRTPERSVDPLIVGDVVLDPDRHLVTKRGATLHLTPKEFELLEYFMRNAGRPVAHRTVLRAIWGPDYGEELEYLRTFVRQLRKKIEDNPASPAYLTTDANIGYRFQAAA
jgi:two-component system KDP operon response regulator KdpE